MGGFNCDENLKEKLELALAKCLFGCVKRPCSYTGIFGKEMTTFE